MNASTARSAPSTSNTRLSSDGVGGLEFVERQLGERDAALHRGADQLADDFVGRALRNALHDEVFHQRRGVEVAVVEPGGDRFAVQLGAGDDRRGQFEAGGARCRPSRTARSLSSCRSRL